MKAHVIPIALWFCAALSAGAQVRSGNFIGRNMNSSAPPAPKPPEYRFVTNQLFQIHASSLWKDYDLAIVRAQAEGIAARKYRYAPSGELLWGAPVLLLNYPSPVVSEQRITARAIEVGTTNINESTCVVLDHGITPQENARRRAAQASANTNSVAARP